MNQSSSIEWHELATDEHEGSFFSAEQMPDDEWELARRLDSDVRWYPEELTDDRRRTIENIMQAQQGQCIRATRLHCRDLESESDETDPSILRGLGGKQSNSGDCL
jgi:hypothetical protein